MDDEYGRIHTDGSRSGGQPVVDNAMLEALQKDAGLPHLPTRETYQFRMAVSGEGPLAYQWSDKPHRLLYNACSIIESEAAENEALRHDLERQMTIANEQVNEVERLLNLLRNCNTESISWLDARDAALEQSK